MIFFDLLYSICTILITPIVGVLFLVSPRGRRKLQERFGSWGLPEAEYLWFHGASVGEIRGLIPVMVALRGKHPQVKILCTATSTSGLEQAKEYSDEVRLLPFDHPIWIRRALGASRIKAFIFGETEIWPALISFLHSQQIPMFLVNGRISNFSFNYYLLFKALFVSSLRKLAAILVADAQSAQRFLRIGAFQERIRVCGNTKYDRMPSLVSSDEIAEFRKTFFAVDGLVVTLGSVHPGEEAYWLTTLAAAMKREPTLQLVVVPRHPERVPYFARALTVAGIPFVQRSRMSSAQESQRVVLVDSIGELEKIYSFSDLSFIGGSLVPGIGGHNPMEAAAYGSSLVMGGHYKNCEDVVEMLRSQDALRIVSDAASVESTMNELVTHPENLKHLGKRAQIVWEGNVGATSRVMAYVENHHDWNLRSDS